MNFDNFTLSLGLVPTGPPGDLRYRMRVDKNRSEMDISFAGIGPNPLGDILMGLFNLVASWLDAFEDDVYDAIQKMLDEGIESVPVFRFPEIWNVEHPPTEERLRESFPQPNTSVFHALEGHSPSERTNLVTNTSIASLTPPALSDYLYAASQRYLTNWVRQHTRGSEFFNITDLPLHLAPTLPDPNTLPEPPSKKQSQSPIGIGVDFRFLIDPETGTVFSRPQCRKPADPSNEYLNRLRFTRSLSKVEMPPDGPSPIAGTLVLEYEFTVEAVRFEYQYRLDGYTQGRCIVVPPLPGIDTFILAQRGWTPLEQLQTQGRIVSTPIGRTVAGRTTSAGMAYDSIIDQPPDEDWAALTPIPDGDTPDGITFPPDIEAPGLTLPSEIVCLEPECAYTLDTYETILETYLKATARFEAGLWYGPKPIGDLWLPELILRLMPGSGASLDDQIDDAYNNGVTVTVTQAELPFVNDQALNDLLADIVRVDARALVDGSTLEFARPSPQGLGMLRTAFPGAGLTLLLLRVDADEEALLADLAVFETIPIDSTGMFLIQGNYSFLPIQMRETLSQHIPLYIVGGNSIL